MTARFTFPDSALAMLAAGWLAAAGPAAAGDSTERPPEIAPPTAKSLLVDGEILKREREIRSLIMEAFQAARGKAGNLGLYSNLVPRDLSFRQAVMTVLDRNLSIKRQGIAKKIADAVLAEASAVFDPVLSVSLAYNHKRTEERIEDISRFKSGTDVNDQVTFSKGPIASLQFDTSRAAGFFRDIVTANERSETESLETWTSVFDVAQLLPWGTSFDLKLQIKHEPTYFILNSGSGTSTSFDSYDRPWVSTLVTSVSSPVPFSSNFGPLNASKVVADLSRLDARKAAWNMRAVVNDTLLQTDQGFWDLVSATQRLKAALETRSLVEDLWERTERLFELRQITESRRDRVGGELERVKGQVETEFDTLVKASNSLAQLLGQDDPLFLLPAGYLSIIEARDEAGVDPESVIDNPEYLRALIDVQSAQLTRDALEVRTRPDVTVSGSVTLSQLNSVFGYRGIENSLNQLPNPDQVAITATTSYFRPLGNRAAESAFAGSRHSLIGQHLAERSVKNRLLTTFEQARINLNSARQRIEITRRNRDLAGKVYGRSLRFQRSRKVTEFEIIERLRALLSAKNDHIEALIDAKKAESNLLASVGLLSERYARRISQTPVDRHRLKALAAGGMLTYFGEAK